MSISQGVVSYPTTFPSFGVDEPLPRPGNGRAFAAALARNPAPQSDLPGANEGAATDDDPTLSATGVSEEPDPDREEGLTASSAVEEAGSESRDGPTVEPNADSPEQSPTVLATLQGLAVAVSRADPQPATEDTAPAVSAPPDPDAARPLPPAAALDTPEGAAASNVGDEVVVSAAQLPFMLAGRGVAEPNDGGAEANPAMVAALDAPVLSTAVQVSRAVAGFGQGLTAIRPNSQTGKADPQTGIAGQDGGQPAVARPAVQVHPADARRAAEAPPKVADKPDLPAAAAGEPAGPGGDTFLDPLPLSGGTHSVTVAPAGLTTPAPVVPIPSQLAPVIATAARQNGTADITVTLSPEELGTLHLRVSMEGDALRVTLLADRPETLDLLRRHGDQLLTDLRNLGFGGASLGFGSSGGGAALQRLAEEAAAAEPTVPAVALPHPLPAPSRTPRAGGLDIRL